MLSNCHERPVQQLSVDYLSEQLCIPHLLFFCLVAPNPSEKVEHSIETNKDLADVSPRFEQKVFAVDVLTDV